MAKQKPVLCKSCEKRFKRKNQIVCDECHEWSQTHPEFLEE